ncbi:MAG: adenosine kinase [Actinobacteria bacterium]|nr:adenosine kinase [Actinomycetota bacterium]MCL6104599.1 adenosine kinase [Actinomycetota bacterium]
MRSFDVVGIGHAIVDVLDYVTDDFLEDMGLLRGTMCMAEEELALGVISKLNSPTLSSGGSAANTMAAIAALGGRAAFVGKVAADSFGHTFSSDLKKNNVFFDTKLHEGNDPTGRCVVMVEDDGERTMLTHIGAAAHLSVSDIDASLVSNAEVVYIEGYLFDHPTAKQAVLKGMVDAKQSGAKVALSLSDPFCIERHREEFLALVMGEYVLDEVTTLSVDLVFGNEQEAVALWKGASYTDKITDDFEKATELFKREGLTAVLTRGERGSQILAGDVSHIAVANPAKEVVDTTGAGDSYAAGFLYGFSHNMELSACARLGSLVASLAIESMGARPSGDLSYLVSEVQAG